MLDESSPLYSHVVLSPGAGGSSEDGLLEAWEMMDLRLDADLVILSACETGRGRIAPGEGVVGTMWAAFVAGSQALLVSQWKVESASTTELMTAFHRGARAGEGEQGRTPEAGQPRAAAPPSLRPSVLLGRVRPRRQPVLTRRCSIRSLRGFVDAPDDAEAEQRLATLLEDEAAPLVRKIAARKLRAYGVGPANAFSPEDLEDVAADALLALVSRLQALRSDPHSDPIESFADYTATVTYNTFAHYLRRRHPAARG